MASRVGETDNLVRYEEYCHQQLGFHSELCHQCSVLDPTAMGPPPRNKRKSEVCLWVYTKAMDVAKDPSSTRGKSRGPTARCARNYPSATVIV